MRIILLVTSNIIDSDKIINTMSFIFFLFFYSIQLRLYSRKITYRINIFNLFCDLFQKDVTVVWFVLWEKKHDYGKKNMTVRNRGSFFISL